MRLTLYSADVPNTCDTSESVSKCREAEQGMRLGRHIDEVAHHLVGHAIESGFQPRGPSCPQPAAAGVCQQRSVRDNLLQSVFDKGDRIDAQI
jgi:hypothetical protein